MAMFRLTEDLWVDTDQVAKMDFRPATGEVVILPGPEGGKNVEHHSQTVLWVTLKDNSLHPFQGEEAIEVRQRFLDACGEQL